MAKIRRKEIVILCCRSWAIIDIVYCRLMFGEALKLNYFKELTNFKLHTLELFKQTCNFTCVHQRLLLYLLSMYAEIFKVHAGLFENQSRPILKPLCAWEASIRVHYGVSHWFTPPVSHV